MDRGGGPHAGEAHAQHRVGLYCTLVDSKGLSVQEGEARRGVTSRVRLSFTSPLSVPLTRCTVALEVRILKYQSHPQFTIV